jgi:hypothetical protein
MIRNEDGSVVLQSLDELLTAEECALWLKMEEDTLRENVRLGRLPVVKVNRRVLRFHPRSILLSLGIMREALLPSEPSTQSMRKLAN